MEDKEAQIARFPRMSRPLYKTFEEGLVAHLEKVVLTPDAASNVKAPFGRVQHPFNFEEVINIKNFNIHHSTCIETKRDATVGIGFESDKPDKLLDPLCEISFQNVLSDICEDYWQVGNAYMEVRRDKPGGTILGLYHLPTTIVFINLEEDGSFHWDITGGNSPDKRFARFGDAEDFIARTNTEAGEELDPDEVSEVIAFPRPTSLDRWYGYPDWLSAVSIIELVQCMTQYEFDFFLNRGVPEFFLFFLGSAIDTKTWDKLTENMKAHIGLANSHKSSAYNFQDPNLKIELIKLGMEDRQQGIFSEYFDTTAMAIVSAHRVPPLLAGIQIPGKLGATNELPNALMAFQLLVLGQAQRSFQKGLEGTLGNSKLNGGLGLGNDFEFKKITEELNLDQMDTMSRMREPAAGGRDTTQGLKQELNRLRGELNGEPS